MSDLIETRPTGPAAPLPPPRSRRSPPGVRVLWKVFAGLLVLGALVWGPYQVVTLLAHEERVENETFEAAGIVRLEIEASSGSIDIEASDRTTIAVRAEISDGLRRTGESRAVEGDALQLRSSCPAFGSDFCSVDYEVLVPRDLELVLASGNGPITVTGSDAAITIDGDHGSVHLSAVSGPLQVSTDDGRIEATQLRSATVTADSDNGRVELQFASAPRTVVATTEHGRVDVVVPDDGTEYRADIQSDHGSEDTTIPTDPDSERTITIRTHNGSATARTG